MGILKTEKNTIYRLAGKVHVDIWKKNERTVIWQLVHRVTHTYNTALSIQEKNVLRVLKRKYIKPVPEVIHPAITDIVHRGYMNNQLKEALHAMVKQAIKTL